MSKWKKEDLVNHLKKKSPTSGNKDDLLKSCMLWKCLTSLGRNDLLKNNARELQIKANGMNVQLRSQKLCETLEQMKEELLDVHVDQEQLLIESTNAVIEDFNNVTCNFKLIKLITFAHKIPTQLK